MVVPISEVTISKKKSPNILIEINSEQHSVLLSIIEDFQFSFGQYGQAYRIEEEQCNRKLLEFSFFSSKRMWRFCSQQKNDPLFYAGSELSRPKIIDEIFAKYRRLLSGNEMYCILRSHYVQILFIPQI